MHTCALTHMQTHQYLHPHPKKADFCTASAAKYISVVNGLGLATRDRHILSTVEPVCCCACLIPKQPACAISDLVFGTRLDLEHLCGLPGGGKVYLPIPTGDANCNELKLDSDHLQVARSISNRKVSGLISLTEGLAQPSQNHHRSVLQCFCRRCSASQPKSQWE
jgi:hypothetical protein